MHKTLFFVLFITIILLGIIMIVVLPFFFEKTIYSGHADLEQACKITEIKKGIAVICQDPVKERFEEAIKTFPELSFLRIINRPRGITFFEISAQDNHSVFERALKNFLSLRFLWPFGYDRAAPEIFSYLPQEAEFSFSSKNFSENFLEWRKQLQQVQPLLFSNLDQKLKEINSNYHFSLLGFLPFLGQVQFVALGENQYVAAIKNSSSENLQSLANFLEQAVLYYLASISPKEAEMILPDKTSVKELIFDPGRYQFQTREHTGLEMHFIDHKDPAFEFAYTINKGQLIFSANYNQLLAFLNKTPEESLVLLNLQQQCFGILSAPKKDSLFWILPEEKGWLVINSLKNERGVIEGCIVDKL